LLWVKLTFPVGWLGPAPADYLSAPF